MQIKQDPVTRLWCREDGAVLMPPGGRFKAFRWTFGSKQSDGYCVVGYRGKLHKVHQIICRAFNSIPPADKPFVDHINRIKDDNRSSNLRWADRKENADNADSVDKSIEKYGARACEDKQAYGKAYHVTHREERMAYMTAYAAKMKAKGLSHRRGPNGKFGWYPRIRPKTAV